MTTTHRKPMARQLAILAYRISYMSSDISRYRQGASTSLSSRRTSGSAMMPRVLNMRDLPDGLPDGAIYCGRLMPRRRVRKGN
jgi:hypothetical protein